MLHRASTVVSFLLCLGLAGVAQGQLQGIGVQPDKAHYLVFETDGLGRVEPVFHAFVELAQPLESATIEQQLSALSGGAHRNLGVEVWKAADVVFRAIVRREPSIRGEFHGAASPGGGYTIDGHRFAGERESFVVRVPRIAGAELVLTDGASRTRFGLDALAAAEQPLAHAVHTLSGDSRVTHFRTGAPGNRVDLLIMGDGFTSPESFAAAAARMEAGLFSISPYSDYQGHVNIDTLYTPSAEAGADHPPYDADCPAGDPSCCGDRVASNDPLSGTYVDTAFNGRFCAFNIHRLAVVSNSLAFAAAAAVPDWDRILMLLNDTTYGGSGGSIAVATTHAAGVDVMQHEYGHSFTGLGDEYESSNPDFPSCSDSLGPACEVNVTDETSLALIKWAPWIEGATPIPTPENSSYAADVGLFEGARYMRTGMYRPREDCLMRSFGGSFGEICAQTYVLKLYEGGWGVPAAGIDPIEPGLENPAPGTTVHFDTSTTFSTLLLAPVGGPPLHVRWMVDGVPQAGETGSSFVFRATTTGCRTVEIQVSDATSFVHPAMAGATLRSHRRWTACADTISVFRVIGVEPAPRSLAAPRNGAIVVDFDRQLDPASVVPRRSFWAFGRWSGAVHGEITFSRGRRRLTLQPDRVFAAGESVMVILSHDIRAADGTTLRPAGYSFQFWTQARRGPMRFVANGRMSTRATPGTLSRAYGGVATDLNGDRFPDLTIVNEDTGDLAIFLNRADRTGTFDLFAQPTVAAGDLPSLSEPHDFNHDGDADLVVIGISGHANVLLGNGDGTFASPQSIDTGEASRGVAVLDADGDGDVDLVVSSQERRHLSLLRNDGDGNFGVAEPFQGSGPGEWALAASDMNEDGILDLVVGDQVSKRVFVQAGNGDGTFRQVGARRVGGEVWMMAVGDVNGDGHDDVAAVNGRSDTSSILLGDGRGELGQPRIFTTESFPLATDLGDLDGDGDLDWMVSRFFGGWSLFVNDGGGGFSLRQDFEAAGAGSCSLMVDVDNDRDLDLALIDEIADEVTVLLNDPAGVDPGE